MRNAKQKLSGAASSPLKSHQAVPLRKSLRKGAAKARVKPMARLPPPSISSVSDGHGPIENPAPRSVTDSSSGVDHYVPEIQPPGVDAGLISEIKAQHRKRVDFHRPEKSLILQARAICRRLCEGSKEEADLLYDALGTDDHPKAHTATGYLIPFMSAMKLMETSRKAAEKAMVQLAKHLSVWSWVEGINGFGALGLAQIVAEAGDLFSYSNPGKLWKRMGLAPYDGKAASQWRKQGGLKKEEWESLGYSPVRRSIMYSIGDSLLKKQGPYREIYLARKAYEIATATAAGLTVVPAAKIPEKGGDKYRSAGHVHLRAQRYMEKRLLRDLWSRWRGQDANAFVRLTA